MTDQAPPPEPHEPTAAPRRVALMFDLHEAGHHIRQLVLGVHRYAADRPGRWHCIHDPFADERLVGHYDGLIAPGSRTLAAEARRAGLPYVAATCHSKACRTPRVVEHRREAGALAARHLFERGYTRFGYLGIHTDQSSLLLEDGFRYTVHARGHGTGATVHSVLYHRTARAWSAFRGHLDGFLDAFTPPVGIFTARDVLALYLAEACRRKGLRIPDDVGLIGAGNDPAICGGAPLPLTSIDFAADRVGYRAAALLDHLMDGGVPPAGTVYIRPALVPRHSTGRAFFPDTLVSDALAHIATHCHRRIRVADVARAVGLSARQLLRRFRRTRRRTVAQEITRARLRHAEDILQATDLTVDAVARAIGFATGRHLRSVFLEHHRLTPTAWRRGRPAPPPCDPADYGRAKRLLEATTVTIDTIAYLCNFPNAAAFRRIFREREGILPGVYRKRHRRPPDDVLRIIISLDDTPPPTDPGSSD